MTYFRTILCRGWSAKSKKGRRPQRAEDPKNPEAMSRIESSDELTLARRNRGKDIGDGVFVCKCGTDNELVYMQGPHPFKDAKCRSCKEVFVPKRGEVSDIMRLVQHDAYRAYQTDPQEKDKFGRICPCGVTHRVHTEGFIGVCSCQLSAGPRDTFFHIGSPRRYHVDPENTTAIYASRSGLGQSRGHNPQHRL